MKKHTIGVMVLGFTGDYIPVFLHGIVNFAKGKNVNIVSCQVKLPEWQYGHFDYQYIASLPFFKSNTFDAIIVLSNFFISTTTREDLISYMETLSDKPIVSVGVEFPFQNSHCLTSNCETAYREIFSHLINEHGCKRIGFLAANSTTSEEAKERFDAYKKLLEENNMKYDPSIVFEGAFSLWQTHENMTEFLKHNKVDFDAIISANDQMAFGMISVLNNFGYKVPEDVKVIGYDDSYDCRQLSPTVSTINQNIEIQGYEAAKIAFEKMSGIQHEKISYFPLKAVYRQSCGCVSRKNEETDYIGSDKVAVHKNADPNSKSMEKYAQNTLDMLHIYELLDLIQTNTTITNFFEKFEQTLQFIDIKRFALCLYDEPITVVKGEVFSLPDKVEFVVAIDREHTKKILNPNIFFNPYENIIPDNVFDDDYSNYIVEPVFVGEKQYGYAVYSMDPARLSVASIFFRAISSGIVNSYEFTNKLNENEELNLAYKTDELTKLLNRRGFVSTAEQALKYANSIDSKGLVFFCDMDGLKKINDGYGHDMGDAAIKGIAEAIKRSFRKNDVVGRLSGDEFAVVAIGSSIKQFDMLYKKILNNCKLIAKTQKFPFELSLSAGAVEFGDNDSDLQQLLGEADKMQYIEKRRKHAERTN